MKKQITILFLLTLSYSSRGQSSIPTRGPCTDAMVMTVKGRWINHLDNSTSVSKSQKQEAYTRLDVLHNILLKMYPQPSGVDVRLKRSASQGYFGATRKYSVKADGGLTFDYLKKLPILTFSYFANFSPHYCAHTDKGIVFEPGEKNENSDGVSVIVNDFGGAVGGPAPDEDWTINGQPVRMLGPVLKEKWKGYELYGDVRARGRHVLIHRNGMLPYIPVTRKQYLDRCISQTKKLYDKMIESEMQMPVRSLEEQEAEKKAKLAKFEKDFGKDPKRLKGAVDYYLSGYQTDQQIREERVARVKNKRELELKTFSGELEKTSREGRLDSPALILVMYYTIPYVFETDPEKGYMLVTENPDYMQKDLPGHIPQFMVLTWKWNPVFYPVHKSYEESFLQDFPIEKIQAMIDK